jgi:hypothetical protein
MYANPHERPDRKLEVPPMQQRSDSHAPKPAGARTIRDVLRFLRGHWPHFLLLVPMAVGYTILHEASHAAIAIVQGGEITEFVWLPSAGEWGHVRFRFPAGARYSPTIISLAPYLVSLALCATAAGLSLARRRWRHWSASTVFVWLWLVPLGDVANAALPYAAGARNDLRGAFGPPTPWSLIPLAVLGLAAAAAGFWLQRRLYAKRAIGWPAYLALGLVAVALLLAVTGMRLPGPA